ncbi:hypothetical protein J3R83DRAFT_10940 [Lanmaoa asiatica]|nr:hypothetical protein J3R83DRAFT_10940 [Lanmaoa asiatica]
MPRSRETTLGECRAENGISEVCIPVCTTTLLMGRTGRHARDRLFRAGVATAAYDDAPAPRLGLLYLASCVSVRLSSCIPFASHPNADYHRHFLIGAYDGHIHFFDYVPQSQRTRHPSPLSTGGSVLIASASRDLTACLARISLVPDASPSSQTSTPDRLLICTGVEPIRSLTES